MSSFFLTLPSYPTLSTLLSFSILLSVSPCPLPLLSNYSFSLVSLSKLQLHHSMFLEYCIYNFLKTYNSCSCVFFLQVFRGRSASAQNTMPRFTVPFRGSQNQSDAVLSSQQSTPGVRVQDLLGLSQSSPMQLEVLDELGSYPPPCQGEPKMKDSDDEKNSDFLDLSVDDIPIKDLRCVETNDLTECEKEKDGEEANDECGKTDIGLSEDKQLEDFIETDTSVLDGGESVTVRAQTCNDSGVYDGFSKNEISISEIEGDGDVSITQQNLSLFETPMGKTKTSSVKTYSKRNSPPGRDSSFNRKITSNNDSSADLPCHDDDGDLVCGQIVKENRDGGRELTQPSQNTNVQNFIDKLLMSASKENERPKSKLHPLNPRDQRKGRKRTLYTFHKPSTSLCQPLSLSSKQDNACHPNDPSLNKAHDSKEDHNVGTTSNTTENPDRAATGNGSLEKPLNHKRPKSTGPKTPVKSRTLRRSDGPGPEPQGVETFIKKVLSSKKPEQMSDSVRPAKGARHPLSPTKPYKPGKKRRLYNMSSRPTSEKSPEEPIINPVTPNTKRRSIAERLAKQDSLTDNQEQEMGETLCGTPVCSSPIASRLPPETLCTPKSYCSQFSPNISPITKSSEKSKNKTKEDATLSRQQARRTSDKVATKLKVGGKFKKCITPKRVKSTVLNTSLTSSRSGSIYDFPLSPEKVKKARHEQKKTQQQVPCLYISWIQGPVSISDKTSCEVSQSCEIGYWNVRMALKFVRHLGGSAADVSVKFQSDWIQIK